MYCPCFTFENDNMRLSSIRDDVLLKKKFKKVTIDKVVNTEKASNQIYTCIHYVHVNTNAI